MSQITKGYLIAMTGISIWSTTSIFIGYLISAHGIAPLLLAFWRNALVCVALIPALYFIRPALLRFERTQLGFYTVYGLILALFNAVLILSVRDNGAAVATVLVYSSAGFTAILAWWLFNEQLSVPKIVAISLSMSGCVLVSNAYSPDMWSQNLMGIVTGLGSGMLFAAYNMMAKTAAQRKINAWTSLLYSFAFGAIFALMFNLFPILPGAAGSLAALAPNLSAYGWFILIIFAFIPTVLGYGLYNTSMDYLPASIVSLLATTEPVMTAIEAYIFLDERMTLIQVIGSQFILAAVIIVRFEKTLNIRRFVPRRVS